MRWLVQALQQLDQGALIAGAQGADRVRLGRVRRGRELGCSFERLKGQASRTLSDRSSFRVSVDRSEKGINLITDSSSGLSHRRTA